MAEKFLNQHGLETYNNALQAKIATNYATKEYVNNLAGTDGLSYEIVSALPETPETGKIYLVTMDEDVGDIYDEYMWINEAWERIGSTSTDLSQYYTKEEIDNKTNTINQSITAAVSDINILNTWVNTQFDPDVRDIIDAEVSQDIANLTTTVNNLSNQLVSGSKYVYEDGNGNVIITKDGYLGKFVVHSDRTSLYVGEAELAYVKDGKLYANQIKTNGLQIGSWLYELTANGTLNEKWVGGE